MDLGLKGKAALVTGGANGIGRATAEALADEGARVMVADRDVEAGEKLATRLRGDGAEVAFVEADVRQEADVQRMVAQTLQTYGQLDCAVNNAGITEPTVPAHEQSEAIYDDVIATDLKAVWYCLKHEVPPMLERGRGAIVNITSISAIVGTAGHGPYHAAKHGVVGLTRCAALDYAGAGIRVNAVGPGAVLSPMLDELIRLDGGDRSVIDAIVDAHPIGRQGHPREVADAVVWLCSDRASFVVGHQLMVDGGYTVP